MPEEVTRKNRIVFLYNSTREVNPSDHPEEEIFVKKLEWADYLLFPIFTLELRTINYSYCSCTKYLSIAIFGVEFSKPLASPLCDSHHNAILTAMLHTTVCAVAMRETQFNITFISLLIFFTQGSLEKSLFTKPYSLWGITWDSYLLWPFPGHWQGF